MLITSCNDMPRTFLNSRVSLFQVRCPERRGEMLRQVWLLKQPPSIGWLLERVQGIPSMFSTDPAKLLGKLPVLPMQGWMFFQVDDVGLLAGGPVKLNGLGDVHITFWDKVLVGRETLSRAIADWYIEATGLDGAFTAIPSRSRATIAFAERIGFRRTDIDSVSTDGPDGQADRTVTLIYRGYYGS